MSASVSFPHLQQSILKLSKPPEGITHTLTNQQGVLLFVIISLVGLLSFPLQEVKRNTSPSGYFLVPADEIFSHPWSDQYQLSFFWQAS